MLSPFNKTFCELGMGQWTSVSCSTWVNHQSQQVISCKVEVVSELRKMK